MKGNHMRILAILAVALCAGCSSTNRIAPIPGAPEVSTRNPSYSKVMWNDDGTRVVYVYNGSRCDTIVKLPAIHPAP
jgi:hypothetical protein